MKDIGLYKNRLISLFLNSPDICKLLLNKSEFAEHEIDNLLYKQVFPYLYIDETQTEALSYLCIEANIPRIPTSTIKDIQLVIWAICKKDYMEYSQREYLGTRVDILSDMIERSLNNSDRFGIGKLHLSSVKNFFPMSQYYGRELIFTTSDFKVKDV